MIPMARRDGLVVEELADETMLYDTCSNQAHCLNKTAAFVWKHCDGRTTTEAMALLLHRELGLPADEEIVGLALEQLEEAALLQTAPGRPVAERQVSRRQFVRKSRLVGTAAILVPVVSSLFAPTAAAAVSNGVKP